MKAETTIDLLDRAVAAAQSERELSRAMGLAANTLSTARQKGRLSPGVAAALAAHMGESVIVWTLLAVREGERSAALRGTLKSLQTRFEAASSSAARNP